MEFISLFIMAAIIYGIVGIFTAQNGPVRPPQRRTGPPPSNHFPPFPPTRPQPSSTRNDTREASARPSGIEGVKNRKLEQAQGNEGVWGDEGRADKSPEGISDYISTSAIEDTPPKVSDQTKDKIAFDEQSLVQGVIWAEILGKPRSLRPYRMR